MRNIGVLLASAAIILGAGLSAGASENERPVHGQPGQAVRTDEGCWEGTWLYLSRDLKMILWIREDEEGVPEVKLRLRTSTTKELIETDWNGKAEYHHQGMPGTFEIRKTRGDRNTIDGEWIWLVEGEDYRRGQEGTFQIYRGTDGRQAVVSFDRFVRFIESGDDKKRHESSNAWGFRKVSRRLVRWEEIGF